MLCLVEGRGVSRIITHDRVSRVKLLHRNYFETRYRLDTIKANIFEKLDEFVKRRINKMRFVYNILKEIGKKL